MTSSSESVNAPSDFREVYLGFNESTERAHVVADQFKDLYHSAVASHEDQIKTLKNQFHKELSSRDCAIKVISVALLIVAGLGMFFAVKAIQCKGL